MGSGTGPGKRGRGSTVRPGRCCGGATVTALRRFRCRPSRISATRWAIASRSWSKNACLLADGIAQTTGGCRVGGGEQQLDHGPGSSNIARCPRPGRVTQRVGSGSWSRPRATPGSSTRSREPNATLTGTVIAPPSSNCRFSGHAASPGSRARRPRKPARRTATWPSRTGTSGHDLWTVGTRLPTLPRARPHTPGHTKGAGAPDVPCAVDPTPAR
jgi:hypothetical protein